MYMFITSVFSVTGKMSVKTRTLEASTWNSSAQTDMGMDEIPQAQYVRVVN